MILLLLVQVLGHIREQYLLSAPPKLRTAMKLCCMAEATCITGIGIHFSSSFARSLPAQQSERFSLIKYMVIKKIAIQYGSDVSTIQWMCVGMSKKQSIGYRSSAKTK